MIYVPKHTKNRQIHGDIRSRPGNRVVVLRKKQRFFASRVTQYFFSKSVLSLVVIVAIVVATSKVSFLKADEVIFYPHACLGGFDSPKLAEGAPETSVDATKDDFDLENSASLDKTKSAELYCGNFDGDVTENTAPKQIVLTIHMATKKSIEEKRIDGDDPKASVEALDGSAEKEVVIDGVITESASSSPLQEAPPSSPGESPREERGTAPVEEKKETESSPQGSQVGAWLSHPVVGYFVSPVFAEEVVSEPTPSLSADVQPSQTEIQAPVEAPVNVIEDSVKDVDVPSVEPSKTDPPNQENPATLTDDALSVDSQDTTTSSKDVSESENVHSFLSEIFSKKDESAPVLQSTSSANAQFEIKYSLGNNEWNSLAMLSSSDVKTLSLVLPYTPSAWSDLAQVQVMVHSLDNFDERENLLVDGMELRISYGPKDGVEKAEEREYYMGDAENTNPEYYVGFSGEKGERRLLNLRAKEQIGVGIFSLENGAMVMSTSVSDATSTLDPNGSLPDFGFFAVVFTKDGNWCNGKTLKECVSDVSAVSISYFSLLKESKKPDSASISASKKSLSALLEKGSGSSTEILLDQSKEVNDTEIITEEKQSLKKEEEALLSPPLKVQTKNESSE